MLSSDPESGESKTLHCLWEFDEDDGQRWKYQQRFQRSSKNMTDCNPGLMIPTFQRQSDGCSLTWPIAASKFSAMFDDRVDVLSADMMLVDMFH